MGARLPYPPCDPGRPLRLGQHARRVGVRSARCSSRAPCGPRRAGWSERGPTQPDFTAAYRRAAAAAAARATRAGDRLRGRGRRAARLARVRPPTMRRSGGFLVAEQRGLAAGAPPRAVVARAARRRARARGLKIGLVSNLFDPPALLRELCSASSGCSSGSMRSPSRPRSASASRIPPSSSTRSERSASRRRGGDGWRSPARGRRRCAGARSPDDSGAVVRGRRRGRRPDARAPTPHDVLRLVDVLVG